MSKLKDQLKVILPKLSKEANHNQDADLKKRFYLLKSIVESKKDVKKACALKGVSTDFFYEWGGRLKKSKRLMSLKSLSRRPKRSPRQTPKRIEKRIRKLRQAEPSHGPERVSFYLKLLFNITCAPSSVYNVFKRLKLSGQSLKKRLTKRHLKRYTRPFPGYLQMDIKYVPYKIEGQQFYEFNAIDHHSSWRLIRAYKDKSHESLVQFLKELEKECPFAIFQIQTDNGVEFTDKYRVGSDGYPTGWHPMDLWCAKYGIEHRLIPVGVKELNGKVENSHGFDDREFYARYLFPSFESLELNMRGWNDRWNSQRHTKKLKWKTPNETVEAAFVTCLVFLKMWDEKYPSALKLSSSGIFEMNIEPPLPTRKIKKLKRISFVDRYLQWMEWDEESQKSIIFVPVMSQVFPL
jgi:transposase InsO family protein